MHIGVSLYQGLPIAYVFPARTHSMSSNNCMQHGLCCDTEPEIPRMFLCSATNCPVIDYSLALRRKVLGNLVCGRERRQQDRVDVQFVGPSLHGVASPSKQSSVVDKDHLYRQQISANVDPYMGAHSLDRTYEYKISQASCHEAGF